MDTDFGAVSKDSADFHAACGRLGWNDDGLLIYMEIHDATPVEGIKLWEGDCVEIFIGREAKHNFDRIQFLITPGRTAEFAQPRIEHFHILRLGEGLRPLPEGTQYAARTFDGGYAVELLVPWATLGVVPAAGLELGIQLQTGDFNSGRPQFARWSPQIAGARRQLDLQAIRLAETASPPMLAAMGRETQPVTADSLNVVHSTLRLVADGSFAGKTAAVEIGGKIVGKVTFGDVRGGSWTEGALVWSAELSGDTLSGNKLPREAVVILPGGTRQTLAIGDVLAARRQQFHSLEFTFQPWVFAGETLPQFAFKQPLLADILSGGYTITTRYFDADAKPVDKADKPGRYGAVVEITAFGETKKQFYTLYRVADGNALAWWPTWYQLEPHFTIKGMPEGFGVDSRVWTDDPGRLFSSQFKWFFRGSLDNEGMFASALAGLSELPADVLAGQTPPHPTQTPDARHQQYIVKLKQAIGDDPGYPCSLITPKTYQGDPNKRWPLIVYLHGSGTRGSDPIQRYEGDSPYLVAFPQCPADEWWTPAKVVAMVDQLIATMRIDPDRVYLTGVSMGAFATWSTAASYPDRFAAIAPAFGWVDIDQATWLKDMPVWLVRGDDGNPDARAPIDRLRELGNPNAHDSVQPRMLPHMDYYLYPTEQLFQWFLQQQRPGKP
ncbi:MAG: prolyl oligopeptidase family serine peptidase [Phycisphaerae bacterium]|nr:prolyl oligopeptidase family serine peptidase [Phycisphaerae bacterium]